MDKRNEYGSKNRMCLVLMRHADFLAEQHFIVVFGVFSIMPALNFVT